MIRSNLQKFLINFQFILSIWIDTDEGINNVFA